MRQLWNRAEASQPAPAAGNQNSLGLVRIVLALAVIYSHSFVIEGHGSDPFVRLMRGKDHPGGLAVEFFFAISGFLLYASYRRTGGIVPFLRNRVLRIYPAYLVAFALALFVVGTLRATDVGSHLHGALSAHSALAAFTLGKIPDTGFTYPQLNGSLWTIKIEFEAYLVLALIGVLGFINHPRLLALGWAMSVLVFVASHEGALGLRFARYDAHFTLWAYFITGVMFAVILPRLTWGRRATLVAAGVWLLGCAVGEVTYVNLFAGTYLVFRFGLSQGRFAGFGNRSDLSYGTYLFGWPCQVLMAAALPAAASPYLLTLAVIPFVLMLAFVSWHVVEKPALSLKNRGRSRRTAQGTVTPARAIAADALPGA